MATPAYVAVIGASRPSDSEYEIALALQAGKPVLGLGTWDIEGIEPQPDPQTAVARALELARRAPT